VSALPLALLLDLDDTLLRFAPDADACWLSLCERFAPRLGVEPERLLGAIRESADGYWSDPERSRRGRLDLPSARRAIVRGGLARLGLDAPAEGEALADAYTELREERVRPVPGAIQVLRTYRFRGVRTALLTNGSGLFQRRKVERFGLEPLLDVILIEGELGFGKPDVRVFRRALESLEVAPGDAWMAGDNLTADVVPAQRLGLRTIWVDWAGRGLPADAPVQPDRVVQSLAELLEP
jgi:putative hydrolase of the HAD superfamily